MFFPYESFLNKNKIKAYIFSNNTWIPVKPYIYYTPKQLYTNENQPFYTQNGEAFYLALKRNSSNAIVDLAIVDSAIVNTD